MKRLCVLFVLTIISFQINHIISMEKDNTDVSKIVKKYFPSEWKKIVLGLFVKKKKNSFNFAQENWMSDKSFMAEILCSILSEEGIPRDFMSSEGWCIILPSETSQSGRRSKVTLYDVVKKHTFVRSVSSRNLTRRYDVDKKSYFIRSVSCKRFSEKEAMIKKMVGNYKIHVMPRNESYFTVLYTLLEILKTDKLLHPCVDSFKCKTSLLTKEKLLLQNPNCILSRIVIYPNTGKDNAQRVLNALRLSFEGVKGLDITPRYNQKVDENGLIYFTQGDGNYKGRVYRKYYENENCIYYNPTIEGGKPKDYHLKIDNKGLTKSN